MTSIGDKIKELRKNQGLSQSAFAKDLGVTSQAVSKWESNVSSPDIALASLKPGDKEAARKAYKDEIALLKDEWNITFGETVDEVQRKLDAIE